MNIPKSKPCKGLKSEDSRQRDCKGKIPEMEKTLECFRNIKKNKAEIK